MSEPLKCEKCGKVIADSERVGGLCRECWCSKLEELRGFYQTYVERMQAVLEARGIRTHSGTVSGLDETGRPLAAVRKVENRMPPLGEKDRVLWLLHVRDAVFALFYYDWPQYALGLRYVLPSADSGFMAQMGDLGMDKDGDYSYFTHDTPHFLGAVSDGSHVYVLREDGIIYHTNPSLPGPIQMTTRHALHREIWQKFFSEEQIRQSAPWLSDPHGEIVRLDGDTRYYDTAQKMFFWVCAYGSSSEGYDVSYPRIGKEYVLNHILRPTGLYKTLEQCRRGEVPMAAKAELAEEAPEGMEYVPEPNFGWGVNFY